MKIIKCLSEKIEEEIHDAESYIELAMQWKSEQPEVADLFYELSMEEMKHMGMLHDAVAGLIGKYREEQGDPPAGMLAIYDYLHEKHIAKAMEVKVKQGMYTA